SGSNGWCKDASRTISTAASDATSGVDSQACTLDAVSTTCGSVVVGQGTHTVCDTPTDSAGNAGTQVCKTLKLDNVGATAFANGTCTVSGTSGWCRDATDTISTAASDLTSGVASQACTLDAVTTTCGSIGVGQGAHTACDTASDSAGNAG